MSEKNFIKFVGFLTALLFINIVLFNGVFKSTPKKIIRPAITVKDSKKATQNYKDKVDSVRVYTETIRHNIYKYKSIYDTVNIVRYQDSLIIHLDTQIVYLNKVINQQDTTIILLEATVKKVKKQRNISIIGNIVLGTLLILK